MESPSTQIAERQNEETVTVLVCDLNSCLCFETAQRASLPYISKQDGDEAHQLKRIVCISDTHNFAHNVGIPHGDILLCAGDFTVKGSKEEVEKFNEWLGE
jgi:hypothetical protein